MAVTKTTYGYKSSLTGNLYETQAGAESAEKAWVAAHPSTSTSPSTAPTTTSSRTPAATPSTGAGGSGGTFTQYIKTAGSPTVYGRTSDGRWVAFESGDQFTGVGGQWSQIQTVPTAPTGAINYTQWKSTAPATPSDSLTGDSTLDGVLSQLDKYIQDQAKAGNKFNPNIELTPAIVKQFLDQATKEISPYYAGQITSIKDQLYGSLDNLQKSYDLKKRTEEAAFKSNLLGTREKLAAGGAAYSGFRGQEEQNLREGTNRTLEGLGLSVAGQANDMLSTARRAIGTTGIDTAKLPTFPEYSATTTGTGSFTPNRTLDFNTFSAPLTGSLEYDQTRDIRSLTDYLKQQEVNRRVLSF